MKYLAVKFYGSYTLPKNTNKNNLQKYDLFHIRNPPVVPRNMFYSWFLQIRT